MKNIILFLALTIGFSVQAQTKKNKNARYTLEVNGNCEQCKKRIEKAAFAVPGVKSAVWNVDDHQLSLILNEEKTSLETVSKAVAKVGHDTRLDKSTQADYDALHGCCKYNRH